jgi:hypothetical protein
MIRQSILVNITGLFLAIAACSPNASTIKDDKVREDSHLKDLTALDYNLHDSLKNKASMTVNPSIIKISINSKAKLIIKNDTTDSLKLGDRFSIEFCNGISWKRLPILDDILFNDMAYIIPPQKAKELLLNLRPKPLKYKSGKYRIFKVVQIMPDNKELNLTAEFFIQ